MESSANNKDQVQPTPEDPEKKKKKEEKVSPLSSYPSSFINRDLRKKCAFFLIRFSEF